MKHLYQYSTISTCRNSCVIFHDLMENVFLIVIVDLSQYEFRCIYKVSCIIYNNQTILDYLQLLKIVFSWTDR